MSDQWTDRLSQYVDGELGVAAGAALEAHLVSCTECRETLAALRRVVARAGALDDRPPAANLWPDIALRIGLASGAHPVAPLAARGARRRFSFTVPQLAAASIALALVSGSGAWVVLRPTTQPTPIRGTPTPVMTNAGTSESSPRYAAAVASLEQALARNRGQLDTATVRVIDKNLAIIDRAIRDAQSALAADPANSYLNLHLARQMRRKLELLRQAATLASAQS